MNRSRSRREILGVIGSAAIGSAVLSISASAEIDSDAKPDHVSISYDEARLERWQPYLSLTIDASNKLNAMYGYVATSPEWDHDVLAYWARYAVQEGLPFVPSDAHQYDHEPVYLFLDTDAEEPAPPEALELVVYTAYHHYSASFAPESEDLEGSRQSDDETHISLAVVSPWHHYRRAEEGGVLPELRSWVSARSEWEAYGFYEGTSREAVDSPHSMLDRESWWADGTLDARFASLWLRLGLATDDRDELDRED